MPRPHWAQDGDSRAIVTICHTETEDEIHIISMRRAELHEIETLSRYL
jgi:uncharacterized DUF497 family protein